MLQKVDIYYVDVMFRCLTYRTNLRGLLETLTFNQQAVNPDVLLSPAQPAHETH